MTGYCPHCHQVTDPVARPVSFEGMTLNRTRLTFEGRTVRLPAQEANLLRDLMERGEVSIETIRLRHFANAETANIINVYASKLRRKIEGLGAPFRILNHPKASYELVRH